MMQKLGSIAMVSLFGAMLCAAVSLQGQAPQTSVPVSANAYQNQGPPGPANCAGCFPVTPAGQGPTRRPACRSRLREPRSLARLPVA